MVAVLVGVRRVSGKVVCPRRRPHLGDPASSFEHVVERVIAGAGLMMVERTADQRRPHLSVVTGRCAAPRELRPPPCRAPAQ